MKKIVCFIFTVLMALMLCGCRNTLIDRDGPFEVVESTEDYEILRHKETGVYYLWYTNSETYRGGLSVMLNSDGTPYTGG